MKIIDFPLKAGHTAIFLNAATRHPPAWDFAAYKHIMVADGAWDNLRDIFLHATLYFADAASTNKLQVVGDGDSIVNKPPFFNCISEQDSTDFEKIVRLLVADGSTSADVFWASGGEMDHFLGNLSVAAKYNSSIHLRFFDDRQCYFLATQDHTIKAATGQGISLYPFPEAYISSKGLRYEMSNYHMQQSTHQSLRNSIDADSVKLTINGQLLVFIAL